MVSIPVDFGSTLSGVGAKIIFWLGYGLIGFGLVILLAAAYYVISFDHKVTVFPMHGSGKDGVFSFGKPKKNRVKWVKRRTAWRSMWPFMNRRNIEPFDDEYIYPGKQLFAFDLNGRWMPGRFNVEVVDATVPIKKQLEIQADVLEYLKKKHKDVCDWKPASIEIPQDEEVIRSFIQPVPYNIRNWEAIEAQQADREFAQQDFWSENKSLITGIISVAVCCALAGVTIYFTYEFATGGTSAMNNLADSIRGIGVIPARPPG